MSSSRITDVPISEGETEVASDEEHNGSKYYEGKSDGGRDDDSDSNDGDSDDGTDDQVIKPDTLQEWEWKEMKTRLDKVDLQLHDGTALNSKEAQEKFIKEHGQFIEKEPPRGQDNVLHLMACRRKPNAWLIGEVLQRSEGARLLDKDNASRVPLWLAIAAGEREKREPFIEAILNYDPDHEHKNKHLQESLGEKSGTEEGNCIHMAIMRGLDSDLTIRLISKASVDALKQQDKDGRTPLHLAVAHKIHTEPQLKVVQALLDRCEVALDLNTERGFSVYRYHMKARGRSKNGTAPGGAVPNAAQVPPPAKSGLELEQGIGYEARGKKDGGSTRSEGNDKQWDRMRHPINSGDQNQRDHSPSRGPKRRKTIQDGYESQPGSHTYPASLHVVSQALSSTSAICKHEAAKQAHTDTAHPSTQVDTVGAVADKIKNELKLRFLRSIFEPRTGDGGGPRTPKAAERFLYGANEQGNKISLDLTTQGNVSQRTSFISESFLKTRFFQRMLSKLDDTLQYVGADSLRFRNPSEPEASLAYSEDVMAVLFEHLRNHNVTKILKVLIEDAVEPSHSDETIIRSLGGFDVEILNWSKPDLCPQVVLQACPNVRELHLYWSGLNGMLRAWSENEGVAMLLSLTDLHLHQTKLLEPARWTRAKINEFKERLRKSRSLVKLPNGFSVPPIRVHLDLGRPLGANPKVEIRPKATAREAQKKTHSWLEVMDRFAIGLYRHASAVDEELQGQKIPSDLKGDVRICLIDDGVDSFHLPVTERIEATGKSFAQYGDQGSNYRGMQEPFYSSSSGHGTLMAAMICRVFPTARIFPYKLHTQSDANNKIHFTTESAAEALRQASITKPRFDIICMSWTLRREDDNDRVEGRHFQDILASLKKAAENGTLLFCAAPDSGAVSVDQLSTYYPIGAADCKKKFRIGAAKIDGTSWGQSNSNRIVDYILPGHDVQQKEEDRVEVSSEIARRGSSIATALAAGLAGLIIYCVRLAALHNHRMGVKAEHAISAKDVERIKSFEGMNRLFHDMAERNEKEPYLHVFQKFNHIANSLLSSTEGYEFNRSEGPDKSVFNKQKNLIIELANSLMYK